MQDRIKTAVNIIKTVALAPLRVYNAMWTVVRTGIPLAPEYLKDTEQIKDISGGRP